MPGLKARARFLDFGLRGFTSGSLPDSQDPIRAEPSAPNVSNSMRKALPRSAPSPRVEARAPSHRACGTAGACCFAVIATLAAVIREEGAITPAAEWLVDNFHIVEDVAARDPRGSALRDSTVGCQSWRRDPSRATQGYSDWPGPSSPTPTAASSPRLSNASSSAFQRVQALTIGELWAIPIALAPGAPGEPPALAEQIVNSRAARRGRRRARKRLAGTRAGEPARRLAFRAARSCFPADGLHRASSSSACASRIPSRHRRSAWLERAAVRAWARRPRSSCAQEHQRQAAMNVTVRNVITSMRHDVDVRLGGVLRERQPGRRRAARAASNFGAMDFATRDRYRHAIEDLARGSRRTELDVAQEAIARAKRARLERKRWAPRRSPEPRIPATT